MDVTSSAGQVGVVDLVGLAAAGLARRPVWSHQGEELMVNLVVLAAGDAIAAHVNREVEVLLVGVAGEGTVEVNDAGHRLCAGQALIVPRGARRAIRPSGGRFGYLTCHRRRAGLLPTRDRPDGAPSRPAPTDAT